MNAVDPNVVECVASESAVAAPAGPLHGWLRVWPEEDWAIWAEERFVVDIQYRIQKLLNLKGVSYDELATRIGVPLETVEAMFDDEADPLTIRTIGRVFAALGEECVLTWSHEGEV